MIASGVYHNREFYVDDSNTYCLDLKNRQPSCGIYAISGDNRVLGVQTCLYIGSTQDCSKRIKDGHIRRIKKDQHSNCHLQQAVKKDGLENFSYFVLETCDPNERINREQNWLDYYNSLSETVSPKPLFNMVEIADRPPITSESIRKSVSKKAKEYIITFPDGHEEIHKNLVEFCKKYGLHRASVAKIATGMQKQHCGFMARYITDTKQRYVDNTWKLKFNKKSTDAAKQFTTREYIVTFPDNHKEKIRNLKEFSEKRGFSYSSMQNVARGVCKSHKGYCIEKVKNETITNQPEILTKGL
ncbi:MAG: GIY-YIG nuclease family protein, partial [Candidatus Woesearchaeota archaeon]|nr:GIY-YIG nuclease family protein [Candidatus Woesearchaeota archaeon]